MLTTTRRRRSRSRTRPPSTHDRLALLGLLVIAVITAYLVIRLFQHMP